MGGGEGGVEHPTKFSKREGLTESQILEGVAGKEEGDLFQEVAGFTFYIQNKLKSEICNDKKVNKQKCFYQSLLRI